MAEGDGDLGPASFGVRTNMIKSDNAELIARLRARSKARHSGEMSMTAYLCREAADALAKADERIAELEAQLAEQVSIIKDNIITISRLAREAGVAKGKLEISEAAGIVEGWRERAEAAEAKVVKLEHLAEQESDEALNTLHAALDRAATAEVRATALECRVKALEEALTDAIDDLATTLRSAFMGWECSESELLDKYRAALAQSGEG